MARSRPIDDRPTFAVEDGCLVRTVARKDDSSYQHHCSLEAYQAVAYYLEEHAEAGITSGELWDGLPEVACTQASVALAFRKERGCVEVHWRRRYPASDILFEDAMIEFDTLEA